MKNIKGILSLRYFGSVVRGDSDENSDIDIICIYNDKFYLNRKVVEEYLKDIIKKEFDISWYSQTRIESMFSEGHLFAWHLYTESKSIFEVRDFVDDLGEPNKYQSWEKDLFKLSTVLNSIKDSLTKDNCNKIYEAGLIYVCSRNIALTLSSKLSNKIIFSRYAPYDRCFSDCPFPLTINYYNNLIHARHASTRGRDLPNIDLDELIHNYNMVMNWSEAVINKYSEV